MRRKIILPVLLVALGIALGVVAWLRLDLSRVNAPAPAPIRTTEAPVETPEILPADPALPGVQETFTSFLQEQPGRWSLYYAALPEGEPAWYAIDTDPMVSASLIKLFVMGAVYERVGTGKLAYETVYTQLQAMITLSDNAATNTLIALLGGGDETKGMAAVNDWCRRQGYTVTRLNRLMLEENGLQNYTDAGECARLLQGIYQGTLVSESASAEMLNLLLQQKVNDRLPALLPTGTQVAHKTGNLTGRSIGDVGIVYTPAGDYLLCVIGNDVPDDAAAREAIAQLSRTVYGLVTGETEPEENIEWE